MNLNNFTIKSQEALQQAQVIVQGLGQQQIENEHIFKAIMEVDENVTPFILKKLNINVETFKSVLDATISNFPKVDGGQMGLSREAGTAITEAQA
ncbi:MAG: type VI secretion system ATPase TssH, partial [Myroides sp.]|nr:type VI secretion system ATPase TssH [Myroides sp.]